MDIEVSVVMPCLNEAETLETCIRKAQAGIEANSLSAEIVIADNGSTDGSQDIARRLGARVVDVEAKGYGNALRGGIEAAKGKYVVMGDADDSYDFSDLFRFIEKLRQGADICMGSRFKGKIMPGAMPWKHKYIGNPVLSGIGRLFFHCPASDFHCGLRAFTKDAYDRMGLVTTGMEFASELVIKATLKGMKFAEVPITLYKDGRSRPPHLRSWRDGWRHLRFMLLYSPRWLFLLPGLALMLLGLIAFGLVVPGPRMIGDVVFDVHTLVVAGMSILIGFQLAGFGLLAREFAISHGILPADRKVQWFRRYISLEIALILGGLLTLSGLVMLAVALVGWYGTGFGNLDYSKTMRVVIPAVTMCALGVQAAFTIFLLSVMDLGKSCVPQNTVQKQ